MSPAPVKAQPVVDPVEVDRINYLNIVLMAAAIGIAAKVPFETLVVAYAVLGPLHYLTEISWLHDRGYFTRGSRDWMWLVGAAIIGTIATLAPQDPVSDSVAGFVLGLSFVGAAGMVFANTFRGRLAIGLLGICVGSLACWWDPLYLLFAAFLPTLLHVYLFTGLFILHGALKGGSLSGFASLIAFIAAPFICFFGVSTSHTYVPSPYVLEAAASFDSIGALTLNIFGIPITRETGLGMMRLMGFAYAYHYLNWFSKTRIINWHQVSRRRLGWIVGLYVAALAIYAYNYSLGLATLMGLSLAHVLLELPLNFRTMSGLVYAARRGVRG